MILSKNDKFIVDEVYYCPICKSEKNYLKEFKANRGYQQRKVKCDICKEEFIITVNTNKAEFFNNFKIR